MSRLLELRMDAKRRVALPSVLLEAAGIENPTRLLAYAESPGRFVIATPEAAVAAASQRIWADLDPTDSGYDASADVRAMRDEDVRVADRNAAARADSDEQADEDGRRLLAALGLTGA
ncbi:hypothetical protein E4P41_13900 [Geodermatophilus sp. DF01-2]|uniref:hypothetical protein n=1 Tax=Geodermatophilus sp. DF01-2 TaxID=2559610 RepID=UPI001074919D|nr:hypothetical protein [Geodermatophilus sp. DF01_2]TFV57748.1 hypothetical protein E4P41_13900 [Geodermatophilus sp. DF01_2]